MTPVPLEGSVNHFPKTAPAGLLQNHARSGVQYQHLPTIDFFWKDLYRPELFWRSFTSTADYDKDLEAIHVFKRALSAP